MDLSLIEHDLIPIKTAVTGVAAINCPFESSVNGNSGTRLCFTTLCAMAHSDQREVV